MKIVYGNNQTMSSPGPPLSYFKAEFYEKGGYRQMPSTDIIRREAEKLGVDYEELYWKRLFEWLSTQG